MFRNSIKIAWRNMRQQPGYTAINLLGLALGLATSLFILLWVRDERSVDTFHPNQDRFYRMMQHQSYGDGAVYTFASMPGPLKADLMENFPEVELAARYSWQEQNLLQREDVTGYYFDGRMVDAEFLQMIGVPLLAGNPERCLTTPETMVLTESTAKAMFGEVQAAVGQNVTLNESDLYQVAGVVGDLPGNTQFSFDYLIPWERFEEDNDWLTSWGNNAPNTYMRLREGADPAAFDEKIAHRVGDFQENTVTTLFIQPVSELNLYSRYKDGELVGGKIETVRIFTVVAVFIILIACINFMNLATARATRRGKEVGLRKVIGAMRGQLIRQFMGESLLMTMLSGLLAAGLVLLGLGAFNDITGKTLDVSVLTPQLGLAYFGVLLVTALLAGSYPAFYLSHFRPAQVLKGQQNRGRGAATFRKVLVITQFSLSILLLVGTVVVFQQLKFLQSADLGYQRDNLVEVAMQGEIGEKYQVLREELLADPAITGVTASGVSPTNIGRSTWSVAWEGKDPESKILFTTMPGDFFLPQTFGMELVAGRYHDERLTTDSTGFILNEAAAEIMGFTAQEAVNQPLTLWDDVDGQIIGVVKNFHFQSLRKNIDPLIIVPSDFLLNMFVRIAPGATTEGLAVLESGYQAYAPAYPFEYSFLDKDWEALYRSEQMISKVAGYFAGLALIISLLGLFGLAAYTAEQRTKEIGVRKILGASVAQLLVLMSRNFVALVGVSAAIGCGLAYWLMQDWLNDFAYQIPLKIGFFLAATGLTLVVALATVSIHALRSATSNPVKALKQE